MIEAIFYFQIVFLLAFLFFAIWQKSPAFFLMAFVLSMITAVSLGRHKMINVPKDHLIKPGDRVRVIKLKEVQA